MIWPPGAPLSAASTIWRRPRASGRRIIIATDATCRPSLWKPCQWVFHNQYSVAQKDTREVLRGMLDLTGGARQPGGLNHSSPSIGKTGKLLGGAAFARYDQWVDDSLRDHMLTEAQAMLTMQSSDGKVDMPWVSAPVATGPIQATAHAIVTWKQAYERTADDQWLTAISRAEDWLHGTVASWRENPPSSMQDMNYAMIALLGAGVSNAEVALQRLAAELVRRQNTDGGFPLQRGGASSPFATGQTLYALRMMGRSDSDPAVARGTAWLIEHQQADGSWSSSGFGKAEAMWAVLGLVSVDVLSVTVAGLKNGQHVSGRHKARGPGPGQQGRGRGAGRGVRGRYPRVWRVRCRPDPRTRRQLLARGQARGRSACAKRPRASVAPVL